MRKQQSPMVFVVTFAIGVLVLGPAAQAQPAPTSPQLPQQFGFGRAPTADEIAALNIDVMPDGTGLPAGSGTVAQGAEIFANKCAACHGATGREGPADRLVEPAGNDFAFGRDPSLQRTVGNYWPYATTLYDFVQRAMPLPQPGSLQPDEVYSLVAWILHENEIVPADAVINAQTLPQVVMPARDRFVEDNRRGGAEIR